MILRPRAEDIAVIGYHLSRIILGLGLTMLLPLGCAVLCGERGPFLDFLITFEIIFVSGLLMMQVCRAVYESGKKKASAYEKSIDSLDPNWMHGMIMVALSWLAAMILGAIPLWLSGHWISFLDACFESMSGFATTGLSLAQDLDHLSLTHNLWRHFTMFIGGQGIVVVALSFFVKGFSGAFRMYVGEARDERVMPNVINTARFIWGVSFTYLALGTAALWAVGVKNGMEPGRALFHGACIFMAAFDTGGFAPQSQNMLYYHNYGMEIITAVLMVLGAINFRLHYHLWTGNRRELLRNIEMRVLFVSILVTFIVTAVGLKTGGSSYASGEFLVLLRKGFYQLLSGHTGTGFMTVYAEQVGKEWSDLALVGMICAMALGGAVSSTTGGIKMLRIGIIAEAFVQDIKKVIFPSRAMVEQKFHHIKEVFLDDKTVRAALMVTLAYIILYGIGALVGMLCGFGFIPSLFESTSAAANVGLSCGITSVGMPAALKVVYIFQMWAGRLEFIAVFTLAGFLLAAIKGK